VLVVAPALVFGIFETIVAPSGQPFDVDSAIVRLRMPLPGTE